MTLVCTDIHHPRATSSMKASDFVLSDLCHLYVPGAHCMWYELNEARLVSAVGIVNIFVKMPFLLLQDFFRLLNF